MDINEARKRKSDGNGGRSFMAVSGDDIHIVRFRNSSRARRLRFQVLFLAYHARTNENRSVYGVAGTLFRSYLANKCFTSFVHNKCQAHLKFIIASQHIFLFETSLDSSVGITGQNQENVRFHAMLSMRSFAEILFPVMLCGDDADSIQFIQWRGMESSCVGVGQIVREKVFPVRKLKFSFPSCKSFSTRQHRSWRALSVRLLIQIDMCEDEADCEHEYDVASDREWRTIRKQTK